jgi:general secretion pathway protein G
MKRKATGRNSSRRNPSGQNSSGRASGFTLIEMMVVISIILILLGVALPIYSHSLSRAREENLSTNLETLNRLIFQYAQDKQKAPESLNDLVSAKYLERVPDDITGSDTWEPESGDGIIMSLDQKDPGGIVGVHSGSNQVGSNGKPYSEW